MKEVFWLRKELLFEMGILQEKIDGGVGKVEVGRGEGRRRSGAGIGRQKGARDLEKKERGWGRWW